VLLIGIVCLPAALGIAFWKAGIAPAGRAYLLLSTIVAASLLAASGFGLATDAPGLWQRLAAAVVYPPQAVAALILLGAARMAEKRPLVRGTKR
jgi:hypothetical protein